VVESSPVNEIAMDWGLRKAAEPLTRMEVKEQESFRLNNLKITKQGVIGRDPPKSSV
jgi:uncharacterized protein YnzC (UPF0291/DUF896 family)